MGELFRRHRPDRPLAWTGERLVSSINGPIETEHLHRYLLARQLCRGKNVLDIASGEGYGTALLAQTACCVTGVELDAEAVAHASSAYVQKNLRFIEGNATEIPLDNKTFDAVVSFETLEHVSDQPRFLTEAKRVLKPDGFLLLSTPDSDVYSAAGTTPNPFHIRELTAGELVAELRTVFTHVYLLRQKLIHGSTILPDLADTIPYEFTLFEQRAEDLFESQRLPARAPYLLAIASDQPLPKLHSSLYFELPPTYGIPKETAAEIERLQRVEEAARAQVEHLRSAETQVESQGKELQRLHDEAQVFKPELERLERKAQVLTSELDGFRNGAHVHTSELEHLRDQAHVHTSELEHLRDQAHVQAAELQRFQESESHVQTLQAELEKLRGIAESAKAELARSSVQSAQERHQLEQVLDQQREAARQSVESLKRQLESSTLLSRQQALIVRRLQMDLMSQAKENVSAEAAQKKFEELANSHDALLEKLRLEQQGRVAAEEQARQLFVQSKVETEQARAAAARQVEQEIQKAATAYLAVAGQRDAAINRQVLLAAELTIAREEAARQSALREEISRLVIPVWMRKLLPSGLRSTARAIKQTLR